MVKCTECLKEHPPNDWPWEKFNVPVFWTLPDDGAKITCKSCGEQFKMEEVILTQIPCGNRRVLCHFCVDDDWMYLATNKGVFKS